MSLIDLHLDNIHKLCKKHKVSRLFVFGSVLTDAFSPSSDIDLLVDFSGVDLYDYADNYFDLKFALEKLLRRNIDLLEENAVQNPFLKASIDTSKRMIYGS